MADFIDTDDIIIEDPITIECEICHWKGLRTQVDENSLGDPLCPKCKTPISLD